MSDNNGWPNEPGVPLNPERGGLHWIQHYNDDPITYEWCATYNEWFLGPNEDYGEGWQEAKYVGINYKYLGPCLTPTERDAIQAENEKLQDALRAVMCWINEWEPAFLEDEEWYETNMLVQDALGEKE